MKFKKTLNLFLLLLLLVSVVTPPATRAITDSIPSYNWNVDDELGNEPH